MLSLSKEGLSNEGSGSGMRLEPLNKEDFRFFQERLLSQAGIFLSPSKLSLVQSRLGPRLRGKGFWNFSQYRSYLENCSASDSEWQEFVNRLTTNKTEWFREPNHFRYLENEYIPEWRKKQKDKLKVWSAACSTGEEAFTLALIMDAILSPTGVDFEVLATDIDTRVLSVGERGVYPIQHLESIPEQYHKGHFALGTSEISQWMRVSDRLRKKVQFAQHNLTLGVPEGAGEIDLIFCRNVMIYFSREVMSEVTRHLYSAAASGGKLIIGHSESLQNLRSGWTYQKPSVYRKN